MDNTSGSLNLSNELRRTLSNFYMSVSRVFALSVLAVLLSACSTTGVGPIVELDWCARGYVDEAAVLKNLVDRAERPSHFSSLSYEDLMPATSRSNSTAVVPSSEFAELELQIGLDAPVVRFPSGPSRVAALSLSNAKGRVRNILIAPKRSGYTLFGKPDCSKHWTYPSTDHFRIFDPQITFLDSTKAPIEGSVDGEPVIGLKPGKRFVVPVEAHYLVIHGDFRNHWKPIVLEGQKFTTMMPAGGLLIPMPQDSTIRGTRVSTGSMTVSFEPQ